MRGIERLVAGALLVTAVTATAVLARTSAPGLGHRETLRLQSPPRSRLLAPLPVVAAFPEVPVERSAARLPRTPAPVATTVAHPKPVEVSPVAPPAPAPPPPTAAPPEAPAAPAPAPPPAATPAPSPAPTTRVVAAAQPEPATPPTTTKTFGHSHPRGHAWGHVKHAVPVATVDDPAPPDTESEPPAQAPAAPAAPPAPADQPASDPADGSGNGNGHAYGHSKHGNGD
jgi:outer membrane biosynthesis protein TonB